MAPSAVPLEIVEPLLSTKDGLKGLEAKPKSVTATPLDTLVQEAAKYLDPAYKIIEQPIGTRRPIRVACLGAGYSGLMMSIVFSQKMQNKNAELVVYERNEDIGGTWLENRCVLVESRGTWARALMFGRYPGCKCDIPAHNYAYSFAPKADWPNYYATSRQIHQYMHEVVEKYDCQQYVKLEHSIEAARWSEPKSKWELTVRKPNGLTFLDEVDVFINAGGVLK